MNDRRPGEFELIARLFAPLARGFPGALGLTDDAALLTPSSGHQIVITTDTVVAGRHFPADTRGRDAARRALRVNLSDLAGMGASPLGYLLALSLPDGLPTEWIEDFAQGLAIDQAEFGISLIGGDTTATRGPLTATVTALGEAPESRALRRSTAQVGDLVFVSGTIGDSALGLLASRGDLTSIGDEDKTALITRFRLPLPRIALGLAIRPHASACADISDGLVADLGHICEASRVGAEIGASSIPLSAAARRAVGGDEALWNPVLTGGDDYELVFTAPADAAEAITAAAGEAATPISTIGRIVEGAGVTVLDASGASMSLKSAGFKHF